MSNAKEVIYQTTVNTIKTDTGEVLLSETTSKRRMEREPDFIKLYLKDILYLNDLPKTTNGILYQLLTAMDYENRIQITAGFKRQIANDLGIKESTVKQAIFNFQKKEIIIKKDTGMYVVNPFYFGKGEWKNIKKLRIWIEYGGVDVRNLNSIELEIDDEQPESETN